MWEGAYTIEEAVGLLDVLILCVGNGWWYKYTLTEVQGPSWLGRTPRPGCYSVSIEDIMWRRGGSCVPISQI